MRLLTFEVAGRRRLGAEWGGRIVDLQNAVGLVRLIHHGLEAAAAEPFPAEMIAFLQGGDAAQAAARDALSFLAQVPEESLAGLVGSSALLYREDQVRRLAPVLRPGKVICLGLNYRDHAAESNMAVPTEPVVFTKYASSIIGPGAEIVLPSDSQMVDYEAELVFVIGKAGRDIPADRAMEHVAGYTCGHDVSARDYQLKRGGGQWNMGKAWDTFAPIGPVLVTADEGLDPHNLGIRCVLNGETMQNSNTSQFVFNIPETIAYLSHVLTLEPGDVVFTGTPPGVGMARKPPVFLKSGDVVEIQIDGIGSISNPVR